MEQAVSDWLGFQGSYFPEQSVMTLLLSLHQGQNYVRKSSQKDKSAEQTQPLGACS